MHKRPNMNILFVHQSFPGQYRHIVRALAQRDDVQVVALAIEAPSEPVPKSVTYARYQPQRGSSLELHPWCQDYESKVIRGEACAKAALALKHQGFMPDVICAHPGWGEALFLKDVWPSSPILSYQEFYYQAEGFDTGFDPEFNNDQTDTRILEIHSRIRAKTANTLINLQAADWCVTPTFFQKSTFPKEWHSKISVIHDGINTTIASPERPAKRLEIGSAVLSESDLIVTFVNRRIEPYRGAHTFLRAIPLIQSACPDAQIVVVGETTGTSYGSPCPKGEWKDYLLAPIHNQIDHSRVHFTGALPYGTFLDLIRISSVHAYLTYPFVLSWSLLEAMSFGKAVVGSKTAPVQEMITDGINGLLVDFFSPKAVAESVIELLKDVKLRAALGAAARKKIVTEYSLEQCLPRQLELISLVANKVVGS